MGSAFDNLRDTTFEITKAVFGYDATWTSSDGGASYTGKVHFKNPTEEVRLVGVAYDASDWEMEYKQGDFDGLFELVENGSDPPEIVEVDGSNYYVTNVVKVADGATYRARLKPTNNDLAD